MRAVGGMVYGIREDVMLSKSLLSTRNALGRHGIIICHQLDMIGSYRPVCLI